MKNKVEPSSAEKETMIKILNFPKKHCEHNSFLLTFIKKQMTQNFLKQCDLKNQNHKITAFNSISV